MTSGRCRAIRGVNQAPKAALSQLHTAAIDHAADRIPISKIRVSPGSIPAAGWPCG